MKTPDQPFRFRSKNEWRAWLQDNHETQKEAWLVILKNHATEAGVFYEEAVEEAICFGWIDGLMKSVSAQVYFLRFTPRKRGSIWSIANQNRVEQMIAQGRMTGAGMGRVREARENGEWEAAIQREDVTRIPEDLLKTFDSDLEARDNFEKLPTSQKKLFLYWIASSKTEQTRQKRIRETVEMAAHNKRLGKK
jgi:uncharacterized protein YdeI (YjbR/CyaY-like superfamily)